MKMMKNLQSASRRTADSLFPKRTTVTTSKQKIHLNVQRAENALLRQRVSKNGRDASRIRRGPTERMLRIFQIIADEKYPNAYQLAEDLEVGHKTICRDIEYMRDHYRLPIDFDRSRYGYYFSERVDGFPGMPVMTEAEIFALFIASKAIKQYQGTPFYPRLQVAFEKLARLLDTKHRYSLEDSGQALSFRPFAPEETDLQLFEVVTRARKECQILQFNYRKPGEKTATSRRVHPYHLTCCDNRWYLLALDEARSDVRTFALCRIENAVICDEHFTRPENFDPAEYLDGSFTVMKGEGDYEVAIEFDSFATDVLRGRLWHSTQEITSLPGGGSRMRMRLSGLEEVERWVLSLGPRATVIGPTPLIDRIRTTITQLAIRYQVQLPTK